MVGIQPAGLAWPRDWKGRNSITGFGGGVAKRWCCVLGLMIYWVCLGKQRKNRISIGYLRMF